MKGYILLFLLLLVPAISRGQGSTIPQGAQLDCPNTALPVAAADSSRQKAALDSMATLLVGHWKLTKLDSDWSPIQRPNWFSELVINREGQCVVRLEGNWVSSFQLTLSLERGWIYFTISQLKGARFWLSSIANSGQRSHNPTKPNKRGRLSVCESALFLAGYQYERLANQDRMTASLTPIACQDSLSEVKQVQRVKGRVQFRDDLQAYVLDYALDNQFATHVIGLICNWPQAKDYIGQMVSFSGKYFGLPKPVPVSSQPESVYYLRITGFHPLE